MGIIHPESRKKEKVNKIYGKDKENKKSVKNCCDKVLGKRKRKTEREIKILGTELKRNVMWTKESIKAMRT